MKRARALSAAMSLAFLTTSVLAGATTTPAGGSKLPADNPFANDSTLPFHAPHFDKIKVADYAPAFDEGMRVHLAEGIECRGQSRSRTHVGSSFEKTPKVPGIPLEPSGSERLLSCLDAFAEEL